MSIQDLWTCKMTKCSYKHRTSCKAQMCSESACIRNTIELYQQLTNCKWSFTEISSYAYFICFTIVLLPDSPAPAKQTFISIYLMRQTTQWDRRSQMRQSVASPGTKSGALLLFLYCLLSPLHRPPFGFHTQCVPHPNQANYKSSKRGQRTMAILLNSFTHEGKFRENKCINLRGNVPQCPTRSYDTIRSYTSSLLPAMAMTV